MRVLIAPDKFKGSLTAKRVAEAIRIGFASVLPDTEFDVIPIADGGDGTAIVVAEALGGEMIRCAGCDALGRPVQAEYALLYCGQEAVIEMSQASGLWRIAPHERSILSASTAGTGQLMLDAIRRGAETLRIGLGGSATNDGGAGMAAALGFQFRDSRGNLLDPTPQNLPELKRIVAPQIPLRVRVIGMSDVRNPLLGPAGCARVFGPQKGATPEQVEFLENALTHLADIVRTEFGRDYRNEAGAGAAGGLGFGLLAFCGATLDPGFDSIASLTNLAARMQIADLVITAEGKLDTQTLHGKAPLGVARLARAAGKPVIAFAGAVEGDAGLYEQFDRIFPINVRPIPLEESIAKAFDLLAQAAARAAKSWILPHPP